LLWQCFGDPNPAEVNPCIDEYQSIRAAFRYYWLQTTLTGGNTMAKTSQTSTTSTGDAPLNAMTALREAGFGNMIGMSAAWLEAVGDMSAEFVSFVADRVKEDVKVQHQILHCKDAAELRHIQSQFLQKAVDQYQAETGKLIEMGTKAFTPPSKT
jgi:hypothetical protein